MSVAITFSEKHYTTTEAAELLGVNKETVKRYCNLEPPRIKAEKVGRSWMIPKSAIKEYLQTTFTVGRPKNKRRKSA